MPIIIGVIVLAIIGISVGFLVNSNDDSVVTETDSSSEELVVEETAETPDSESTETDVIDTNTAPEAREEDVVTQSESEIVEEVEEVVNTTYADGTYMAESFYFTPRRTRHDMDITLEVENDVVVGANITYDGEAPATPSHTRFDEAYKAEVVGKRLDDISLSRTGGASLTSESFNEAIEIIKAEAAV